MPLKFDTSKKSENELVLEKRVSLRILGKDRIYLMTNDFTIISEKLKSLGYNIPKPEDFEENPALAKNVREKMAAIGATWSFIIFMDDAIVNYYESSSETPFLAVIEKPKENNNDSSIMKLLCCASENKPEEIKALIESGYDVDQRFDNGTTSLMMACCEDACDSVKMLISLGADINATDANGQTPLIYASMKNSENSAKLLLAEKNIELEKKDITGSTALLRAVHCSCHEIIQLLIQAGADINAVNFYGESVLIHSIIKKEWSAATELIKHGADVNYSDKMGRTPLIVAAKYGNTEIVKNLIDAGANINTKDINKNTAFIVAADENSTEILKLLIDTQKISEDEYATAVIKSTKKGNEDAVVILLENAKNKKEMAFAALLFACLNDKPCIVDICIDYDCDVDNTPYFGMSPLMIACYANAEKSVSQLFIYGPDINKADEFGITALMYAASKNNPKILTLLFRNGADRNAKDKNGKTFEDYAKEFDSRTFQQLLLDRMKSKLPESERNREDEIPQEHQPFCERFDWYMQKYFERFPNNKQPDVYKSAGLSKQTFSKIMSNRKADFRPKKDTVIQLALGLKLTLNETEDLLQSAGYAFSERDKKDAEIKSLLSEQNYKLFDWNERIYKVTNKVFF